MKRLFLSRWELQSSVWNKDERLNHISDIFVLIKLEKVEELMKQSKNDDIQKKTSGNWSWIGTDQRIKRFQDLSLISYVELVVWIRNKNE